MEEITKVETVQRNEIVTPNQLLALAIETKADPDRLDKLMDLQIKWEANQAKKAYVEAMTLFRAKCPVIEKTRKVDFPGKGGNVSYKYAGLGEVIEQIKGLMSECGLSHSWRTSQTNGSISVKCIVTHIDGHGEETSLLAMPDNTGSKNSIQAVSSTVSYLERYTLFALLGLASQEMDDDGDAAGEQRKPAAYTPPTTPATTPAADKEAIKAANKSLVENAFFEYQTVHEFDMPDGKIFCYKYFDNEFRAAFKGLTAAKKKAFKWEQTAVNLLAETILPENCLTDIQVEPDA